jgi:hypothetical protein
MTVYGEFGWTGVPTVAILDGPDADYRRERTITQIVGGQTVVLILRDTIVPEDPYLNMVWASSYVYMENSGPGNRFPVTPVSRPIKDALIKTNLVI